MSWHNDSRDISIKEEVDSGIADDHDDTLHVKPENVSQNIETHEHYDNPFENLHLEVKKEININFQLDNERSRRPEVQKEIKMLVDQIVKENLGETEIENEIILEVKQERTGDAESETPHEYPDCDDAGSMDSNEAVALGNVEACLQDEVSDKSENGAPYEANQQMKQEFDHVKVESDLTVTETHLISNKLINTTSTITNPQDGLIESRTTNTLVMEILPMTHAGNGPFYKAGNPEEILPTSYNTKDNDSMDYQNSFQLNSITGNVLSLEQEAYGLLKAKNKRANKVNAVDKQFCCTKCPKIYTTARNLKRHLGVHDSIEKRAMGVIKGMKTKIENRNRTENKKLKAEEECKVKPEVNVKKEGYECTCGKVFQRRSRMETCLRSHNLFSDTHTCYSCITCTKQFKDKDDLAMHRKRLHSRKKFPCKFCPTDYNTRKELFKHLQIHQKVQLMEYKVISEVVKGKKKLRCFMCSKCCSELSELKSHVMDDHKEPYICPHCKHTFTKIIDFGTHTKTSHPEVENQSVLDVLEAFAKLVKAWKCEECELQFHEPDKLALHQAEKHSPDSKSESQFQCIDCRRVFITQKGLTSHRRVHHSTESTEESEAVEKGIMCLECRKMCKDMNALTSHMRLHSHDRKYPCKYCDFRFATPEKRKAHAEIHTGDMKYVCFICEYQCSSENRLKFHKMSLKHLNMKEYLLTGKPLIEEEEQSTSKTEKIKCTLRKKEWSIDKSKKKSDSDSSSSENEAESTCDICGEIFPNEEKMLEHKQTHPFIEFPNEDTPSRIFFK